MGKVYTTDTEASLRITSKAVRARRAREASAIEFFVTEEFSDGSAILVNTRRSGVSHTIFLGVDTGYLQTYQFESNIIGFIQRRDVMSVRGEDQQLSIVPTKPSILVDVRNVAEVFYLGR